MLIDTVCPNCDAVLKAPEGVVGKRVKCKKCDEVFVVRLAGEEEEERPAKPVKMKAPKPAPSRSKSDDEDEEVDKPAKSKKAIRKKDDDEDEEVVKPAKSRKAVRNEDEDEDEEEKPKPKKKGGKGKKKKPVKSPMMLYVLIGVGALVLIGGGIGAYFGFIKEDKPTTPSGGAGTPGGPTVAAASTSGWVEVRNDLGKFNIKYPKQPKKGSKAEDDSPFGTVPHESHTFTGDQEMVASGAMQIPEDKRKELTDEQVLNLFVDFLMQQLGKKEDITGSKSITYKGHRGQDFSASMTGNKGKANFHIRLIVVQDRAIYLMVVGPEGAATQSQRNAFFDSLKID